MNKFSKKNLKKVDRGLLVGAVAKSKQPTGKMKKDVISKAKKEVDNKKNLTKIGKTLRKNYQSRKKIFYIKSALDYPDYLFPPPYIVYLRGKYNSPHFRDSLETYVKVQNIEHMDEGGLLISHREDCPLFREKIVKTKILKKIDYYDTLWFSNSFSHCSYNTAERYYSNLFKSYLCTRIENFMREYKRQVIKTPSPRGEAICGNNSLWNKVNIRSLSHYISFIPTFRVINNRSNAWKLNDRFSLQSGSYEDLVSQVELYYSEKKIKNKDCGIYKDKE